MSESPRSAKQFALEVISRQSDESTYDDLLRELFFARAVNRGLEDSAAGRIVSDDEVKRRLRLFNES